MANLEKTIEMQSVKDVRVYKNANCQTVAEVFSIEENVTVKLTKEDVAIYLAEHDQKLSLQEAEEMALEIMIDSYIGKNGKEFFNMVANYKDDWYAINNDNWMGVLFLITK